MITHREKDQLAPCPFCGSLDLDVTQWVECKGCGAFGPTPGDQGDLSNWNQRANAEASLPHCENGEACVCGGDTPRVRATCGHWIE